MKNKIVKNKSVKLAQKDLNMYIMAGIVAAVALLVALIFYFVKGTYSYTDAFNNIMNSTGYEQVISIKDSNNKTVSIKAVVDNSNNIHKFNIVETGNDIVISSDCIIDYNNNVGYSISDDEVKIMMQDINYSVIDLLTVLKDKEYTKKGSSYVVNVSISEIINSLKESIPYIYYEMSEDNLPSTIEFTINTKKYINNISFSINDINFEYKYSNISKIDKLSLPTVTETESTETEGISVIDPSTSQMYVPADIAQ